MPLVKLYAGLRNLAGTREIYTQGSTIRDVLEDLVQKFPSLESSVMENGQLHSHVVVTINGHHIDAFEGLGTQIDEEDQIAIFPPIAGG